MDSFFFAVSHTTHLYNASIALFSALGLYFVTSNDLSRLLMLLLRQIPPPHSVILKYIIIIKNIPT